MANPTVDQLFGEFSNALERWFDRWHNAIDSSRNGSYPFQQFTSDVAETWVDGIFVSFLPASLLGGVTVTRDQVFPVLRFALLNRNNVTRLVAVPNLTSVTSMASEHLFDASGANKIPTANVVVAKVGTTGFVSVTLQNLASITPQPPAGLYAGNIIGQPINAPIARIVVDLP